MPMLNRTNRRQELHRVNVLIRALSDEMADQRVRREDISATNVSAAMEEALYELRLRKLLICAVVGAGRAPRKSIHH